MPLLTNYCEQFLAYHDKVGGEFVFITVKEIYILLDFTYISFYNVIMKGWIVMKKIVFIGDSITESGKFTDPERLGTGYVRIIHDFLKVTYPDRTFKVINNGISGDRIPDLQARWDEDVLASQPDYLSISIGVNDVWHQLNQHDTVKIDPITFEKTYEELLSTTVSKINPQLILMEPTVIEEDPQSKGNQLLAPYVKVVHKMAKQFSAIVVPTHQAMLHYMEQGGSYQLTTDGVHMNSAGNLLMAKTWLEQLNTKI